MFLGIPALSIYSAVPGVGLKGGAELQLLQEVIYPVANTTTASYDIGGITGPGEYLAAMTELEGENIFSSFQAGVKMEATLDGVPVGAYHLGCNLSIPAPVAAAVPQYSEAQLAGPTTSDGFTNYIGLSMTGDDQSFGLRYWHITIADDLTGMVQGHVVGRVSLLGENNFHVRTPFNGLRMTAVSGNLPVGQILHMYKKKGADAWPS